MCGNLAQTNMPSAGSTYNSSPMRSKARTTLRARFSQPLVQAQTDHLQVVAIHQHQIDQSLGELRSGDAGQHLDVGEFVGDVLRASENPTRRLPDRVLEKLRA